METKKEKKCRWKKEKLFNFVNEEKNLPNIFVFLTIQRSHASAHFTHVQASTIKGQSFKDDAVVKTGFTSSA